jgi:precorrin-6A/cobalt-precorrin-6A reductase
MHVLILGGTGEARALATALAARPGLRVTLSLAGRTAQPVLPACEVRIGGFGGAEALADWLRANRTAILVDATHPFARVISRNAARAAEAAGIPVLVLERPPWQLVPGDRWTRVPDMPAAVAAVAALGPAPARVFLAIGRQEVGAFRAAPGHDYLVRSIEPVAPGDLPPHAETILARGPFTEADERTLLATHRIEIVVAKNSGGPATYAKLAAARDLGLPVILVDRPGRPEALPTVEAVLQRLDHLAASAPDRGV